MSSTTQEMKQHFETLTPKQRSSGAIILRTLRAWISKKEGWIKQITWMSGSNGERTLPMLKYTDYNLEPTGVLLDRDFAPLAGELEDGMSDLGCNQTCLSGVAPQNFALAWSYATYHKDPFNLKKLEDEKFTIFNLELDKVLQKTTKDFISRPDGHTNEHFAFVGKFSIQVFQLRQLNESRYQEEFVKTGKMEKLKLIINNDGNFNMFKDKNAVLAAYDCDPATLPKPDASTNEKEIIDWSFASTSATQNSFYSRTLASDIMALRVLNNDYSTKCKEAVIQYVTDVVHQFSRVRNRLLRAIEQGPPAYACAASLQKEREELGSLPVIFATRAPITLQAGGMRGEVLHKGSISCDLLITNVENQAKLKRYLTQAKRPDLALKVCTDRQFERVFKR